MIGIEEQSGFQRIDGTPVPDAALSTTSTNSVQNKVVTEHINQINDDLSGSWILTTSREQKVLSTADGVKNVGQLLDEALAAYRALTIPSGYAWRIIGIRIPINATGRVRLIVSEDSPLRTTFSSSTHIDGYSIVQISGGIYVYAYSSSGGRFNRETLTSTITYTSLLSVVPDNGITISIDYSIYKKIE